MEQLSNAVEHCDFGEIIPFADRQVLPLFPVEALPVQVADMCRSLSVSMQVPLELPSTVALGVLAACCQNKTVVRIGVDYIEPLNLFTLAIAQSGERKSPVFRSLTAPVYAAQEDYLKVHGDEIARSKRAYALLKKQLEEAERSYAKGEEESASAESIHKLDTELRKFELLAAPKLLIDDATSEKLIDVLEEQGGNVTIASAEGGLFISLKNKAATNATFDVYLKAYSGDNIEVARIGREGNSIKNPRLTLILTCQTEIAKDMINNRTFREKGLPARFLYAMCRSSLGKREVDTPDVPMHVKHEYDALIHRLLEYALDLDEPAYELTLSSDGRAAYHKYGRKVEPFLSDGGRFAHMADWAAKLVGQMLRVAGIIAACEDKAVIDSETINRASEIADWYASNAEILFSATKARESNAQYLLKILLSADKSLTVREAKRKAHHKQNFNMEQTLEELEARNYIRVIDSQGQNKKTRMIVLNPQIYGANGVNPPQSQ